MGAHRLMCGDCRNADDMGRLMGGKTMNLAVTSPPYASQRKYDETSGFQPIVPDEYVAWFDDVQKNIAAALAPDGSFMLNIKEHCEEGQRHLYVKDLLISFVRAWGWRWVDEFVWVHGGTPKAVINRFKNGWESIFQFTRGDHKFRPDAVRHMSEDIPDWGGAHPSQQDGLAMSGRGDEGEGPATGGVGGKQGMGLHRGGIFERRLKKGPNAAKQQGTGTGAFGTDELTTKMGLAYPSNALSLGKNREALGHGAAFPVSLPDFFIKAYTDPGDIVFDPFMGSGTTLVAAHALDRVGYGMEISPAYCDIIVHRWESVSNKKAEVVEAGRKGGRKK
jgi:DNA modification methylase